MKNFFATPSSPAHFGNTIKNFTNSNCKINYKENQGYVHVELLGFAVTQKYREALAKITEICVAQRSGRLIVNEQEFRGRAPEDFKWASQVWVKDWYEKLVRMGIKKQRFVFVLSENVFVEHSIKKTVQQFATVFPGLELAYFDNETKALEFLVQPL